MSAWSANNEFFFFEHMKTSILVTQTSFACQVNLFQKNDQTKEEPATPPALEESGRFEFCSRNWLVA